MHTLTLVFCPLCEDGHLMNPRETWPVSSGNRPELRDFIKENNTKRTVKEILAKWQQLCAA